MTPLGGKADVEKQLRNPLIVALDVAAPGEIEFLCEQLSERVGMFKVGLEALYAMGPQILASIATHGEIFLDVKLHDIPNTVGSAATQVAGYPGVRMFNVHAMGGKAMMEAAVAAADNARGDARPIVLAVTLLTSVAQDDVDAMGAEVSKEVLVARLAETAAEAGCDGVVAAAEDLPAIRRRLGDDFVLVTPGIRPTGAAVGDQKRIATPKSALANGADFIVVGRPITRAENPKAAAESILNEIKFDFENKSDNQGGA